MILQKPEFLKKGESGDRRERPVFPVFTPNKNIDRYWPWGCGFRGGLGRNKAGKINP